MGVRKKISNQGIKHPTRITSSKSGGLKRTNQAGHKTHDTPDMRQLIWQVVAMIPAGQVASYGQIARLIGFPKHSRYVGTTLRNLPGDSKLPWFRVVNASLRIAQRGGGEKRQRALLEAEGISFIGDRIPPQYRWDADNL